MGLIAALMGGAHTSSYAQGQTKHPEYLHALSDLRAARGWLTALGPNNVMGREMDAVSHIDEAIGALKRASFDDGKNLDQHPPIDAKIRHKGRLHKALALLEAAHRDITQVEDNDAAKGWRRGAVKHVDDAIKADKQAIKDAKDDA